MNPEFFSEFRLCIGWGEGELQDNFDKDVPFYEGTQKWQKNMISAVLSQGLLSKIVSQFFKKPRIHEISSHGIGLYFHN